MTGEDRIAANSLPPLPADLAIPRDGAGPLFAEPWEARVFALVVELNAQGRFAWPEFQSLLAEEIGHAERQGLARSYYLNWAAAAERLLDRLRLAEPGETDAEVARLRPEDRTVRAQRSTPPGR